MVKVVRRRSDQLGPLEPYLREAPLEYKLVPYESLRTELATQAVEYAAETARIATKIQRLRAALRSTVGISRVDPVDPSASVFGAADAGANGRDLLIGVYPVITAVGAIFKGASMLSGPKSATAKLPRLYGDEEEARKLSTLVGYYLQFELARHMLEEGGDGVLIDGPLVLRRSVYSPRGRYYGETYVRAYWSAWRSLALLLEEARDRGVPVVGVVKRVRSTQVARRVGLDSIGDSALAALCLSPGEYTSPTPMESAWADLVGHVREAGVDPRGLRPHSVIVRAGQGGQSYRIDVPEYALDRVHEIVSRLYSLRVPPSGLPVPIVAVDRLTRVTNREAALLHRRMFSTLASKLGADRVDILTLLTLQHGES